MIPDIPHVFVTGQRSMQDAAATLEPYAGMIIEAFADGGCSPNPGAGGWGVIFNVDGKPVLTICGGAAKTTNNRMELTAAIAAVKALPPGQATIFSDSNYVVAGITSGYPQWQSRGWMKPGGKTKNLEMWLRLIGLSEAARPHWQWVRGHDGDPGNEIADQLATLGRREALTAAWRGEAA